MVRATSPGRRAAGPRPRPPTPLDDPVGVARLRRAGADEQAAALPTAEFAS